MRQTGEQEVVLVARDIASDQVDHGPFIGMFAPVDFVARHGHNDVPFSNQDKASVPRVFLGQQLF